MMVTLDFVVFDSGRASGHFQQEHCVKVQMTLFRIRAGTQTDLHSKSLG
jgi:hypothetical protein